MIESYQAGNQLQQTMWNTHPIRVQTSVPVKTAFLRKFPHTNHCPPKQRDKQMHLGAVCFCQLDYSNNYKWIIMKFCE